jgi:hypothetical protein
LESPVLAIVLKERGPFQILFIIILILVFSWSCEQDGFETESNYTKISIEFDSNKDLNRKISIIKAIPLETIDSSVFGRAIRLTIHEDHIYILDNYYSNSLFLFDIEGNFLNKTRRGKGKGECYSPVDYHIDADAEELRVYDVTTKKMLTYDLNLNHKTSEKVDNSLFFRNFVKMDNQKWELSTFSEVL